MAAQTDYAAEGRELLRSVNLQLATAPERCDKVLLSIRHSLRNALSFSTSGFSAVDCGPLTLSFLSETHSCSAFFLRRVRSYAPSNAIWRHPETNAHLYVGNAELAGNRTALARLGIFRIVFCQDSDGSCHFEGDPAFAYLKFPIGVWRRTLGPAAARGDHAAVLAYFAPLFAFVTSEVTPAADDCAASESLSPFLCSSSVLPSGNAHAESSARAARCSSTASRARTAPAPRASRP